MAAQRIGILLEEYALLAVRGAESRYGEDQYLASDMLVEKGMTHCYRISPTKLGRIEAL